MRFIASIVGSLPLVALVGCNTAGQNIPQWRQAERAIEWFYENNAWERGASCIPPRLLGVTRTTVVEDTPERLVLDVLYLWDVEGQNDDELVGVPCFGQGERTFVLSKYTGGGYSVASMTGPQRD
jgi:hypothetical protein